MILFIIILSGNICFFAYWVIKVYQELKNFLIKKFEKLYTFFCLCGNTIKYKDLLEEVVAEEDNILLREKYTETLRQLQLLQDEGRLVLNYKTLEKIQFYLNTDKVLMAAGIEPNEDAEKKKKEQARRVDRI